MNEPKERAPVFDPDKEPPQDRAYVLDPDKILPKTYSLNVGLWTKMDPNDIKDDFVIPGLPLGSVGAMIAPGGTGKSYWALELAMAVATPLADVAGLNPAMHGDVLYLNGEDVPSQLMKRLAFLGQRITPEARNALHENLQVGSTVGEFMDLGVQPRGGSGDTDIETLAGHCKNYTLIILDTLSRYHRLEENDNGQMSRLVSQLEFLATNSGAAVMFLHHTNKTAIREGDTESQAAARGANSLIANIRYASFLVKMTEHEATKFGVAPENRWRYVRYGIAKQNYGLPQEDRWFERRDGGVLVPANLATMKLEPQPHSRKDQVYNGEYTEYRV